MNANRQISQCFLAKRIGKKTNKLRHYYSFQSIQEEQYQIKY